MKHFLYISLLMAVCLIYNVQTANAQKSDNFCGTWTGSKIIQYNNHGKIKTEKYNFFITINKNGMEFHMKGKVRNTSSVDWTHWLPLKCSERQGNSLKFIKDSHKWCDIETDNLVYGGIIAKWLKNTFLYTLNLNDSILSLKTYLVSTYYDTNKNEIYEERQPVWKDVPLYKKSDSTSISQ